MEVVLVVMQIGGKGKVESTVRGGGSLEQNPICAPWGNRPCMTDVTFVLAQEGLLTFMSIRICEN